MYITEEKWKKIEVLNITYLFILEFLYKEGRLSLMENEQCGICWNLKFDKEGNQTHVPNNQPHDFVPLDYCLKCQNPKYDQYGFPTHPKNAQDREMGTGSQKDHMFVSGIEEQYQRKQRKQKLKLIFTSLGVAGITTLIGFSGLFF